MSRPGTSHDTKAMTRIKHVNDGWKITARTISKNNTGIDSRVSTMRIMRASTQPPKKPETAPYSAPHAVPRMAAASPTTSEFFPPNIRRPRMSNPALSVPSRCCPLGEAFDVELTSASWALVWLVW